MTLDTLPPGPCLNALCVKQMSSILFFDLFGGNPLFLSLLQRGWLFDSHFGIERGKSRLQRNPWTGRPKVYWEIVEVYWEIVDGLIHWRLYIGRQVGKNCVGEVVTPDEMLHIFW